MRSISTLQAARRHEQHLDTAGTSQGRRQRCQTFPGGSQGCGTFLEGEFFSLLSRGEMSKNG